MLALVATTFMLTHQVVDFERKAARVPIVLEELAAKTGRRLACDGVFDNEVVVIRAIGVEPQRLLDRLAQATAGKWEVRSGRETLIPDLDRRAREESSRIATREKTIQQALDRLAEELAAPYDAKRLDAVREFFEQENSGADYRLYAQNERMGPLTRACARAAIALGAKRLTQAERGKRFVFSLAPNRLQEQWTTPAGFWDTLRHEWDVLQQTTSGWSDRAVAHLRPSTVRVEGGAETTDLGAIGAAWLSISDPLQSRTISPIELTIVSPDGRIERSGSLRFNSLSASTPAPPASEAPNVELPLDPRTSEFVEAMKESYRQVRTGIPKGSPLYRHLIDPLAHDPLELGSEIYIGFAKARGLNLVANLNDNSFYRATAQRTAPLTARLFESSNRPFFAWTEDAGWLVLSPSQPSEARRNRDDRKALARLFQGIDQDGRVDLDERAQYLLSRPYAASSSFGPAIGCLLDASLDRNSFATGEDAQRVWATLTPTQKRTGKLLFGQLDAKGRAFAERAIYCDRQAGRASYTSIYADAPFGVDEWYQAEAFNRGSEREPTRLFPNGIPLDAPITLLERAQLDILQFQGESDHMTYGSEPIYSVASNIFFSRHPDLVTGDVGALRFPDRFVPIAKRLAGIRLELPGGYAWLAAFADRRQLSGRVAYADLPAEFKAAIEVQLQKLEKQLADGNPPRMIYHNGGQGGAKIPPR